MRVAGFPNPQSRRSAGRNTGTLISHNVGRRGRICEDMGAALAPFAYKDMSRARDPHTATAALTKKRNAHNTRESTNLFPSELLFGPLNYHFGRWYR